MGRKDREKFGAVEGAEGGKRVCLGRG